MKDTISRVGQVVDASGKLLIVYHGRAAERQAIPPTAEDLKVAAAYEVAAKPIWARYYEQTQDIFKTLGYEQDPTLVHRVDLAIQDREVALASLEQPPRQRYVNLGADLHGGTFDVSLAQDIGIHFSSSSEVASEFARDGAVFPAYLSIQNMVRVPDVFLRQNGSEHAVKVLAEAGVISENFTPKLLRLGRALDSREARLNDPRDLGTTKQFRVFWAAMRKAALASGVDGLVYRNDVEGGGDSYVVFRAEQIQSAIS